MSDKLIPCPTCDGKGEHRNGLFVIRCLACGGTGINYKAEFDRLKEEKLKNAKDLAIEVRLLRDYEEQGEMLPPLEQIIEDAGKWNERFISKVANLEELNAELVEALERTAEHLKKFRNALFADGLKGSAFQYIDIIDEKIEQALARAKGEA